MDKAALERANASVIAVGDSHGFVVEGPRNNRIVITAEHCLPFFPPSHAAMGLEKRTYQNLLAPLGGERSLWAECLFADPIGDMAVLGSPDDQALWKKAEAYHEPRFGLLICRSQLCPVCRGPLSFSAEGSRAIGVISVSASSLRGERDIDEIHDGPKPRLVNNLPGWLLRDVLEEAFIRGADACPLLYPFTGNPPGRISLSTDRIRKMGSEVVITLSSGTGLVQVVLSTQDCRILTGAILEEGNGRQNSPTEAR